MSFFATGEQSENVETQIRLSCVQDHAAVERVLIDTVFSILLTPLD